jgi:FAD/FMN-containing dehydrogenase
MDRRMNFVNSDAAARFADALGPKGIITDPADIAPWLVDWRGVYAGESRAILSPSTTQEVAACLQIASEHGIALVPQGGNTSMVGGATPPLGGGAIILSLRRMNSIRSVDAGAGVVVAEAGVILQTLQQAALDVQMRFPLTLGARGSATVGGLCSTNAGGTQVLRFGTMRKLVLGVEAVLPDGSIHNGLSVLKKDTRGYDLTQLLVGAEGTLGIITAASLRIVPKVSDRAAAWFGVESPSAALALLRFFEARSGAAVESFELMSADSLELVYRHIPGTRSPLTEGAPWQVLVEYVAAEQAAEALTDHASSAFESGLVVDATIAASESQIEAFWHIRDSMSSAERAHGPAMQHDISVPVDAMPIFMTEAVSAVEAKFKGVVASGYGHLGDGNIHFHVRAPEGADDREWRATEGKRVSSFVYDLVDAAGGSISAEHGIGQMKLDDLERLSSPARLAVLRSVKQALDPRGIMNPGKLVPSL